MASYDKVDWPAGFEQGGPPVARQLSGARPHANSGMTEWNVLRPSGSRERVA
ncbi:hypothetical protein OG568_13110 [Streptomyces sp. NBC_01450]|uniref:hypothetical protein n=1 Tax=Streptomyces sp. NBC_01450 TaxID=2903871 RepID=UPI002E30A39F|nr:hypothetical protein [Streptomyces sp. NBC_01450]